MLWRQRVWARALTPPFVGSRGKERGRTNIARTYRDNSVVPAKPHGNREMAMNILEECARVKGTGPPVSDLSPVFIEIIQSEMKDLRETQ